MHGLRWIRRRAENGAVRKRRQSGARALAATVLILAITLLSAHVAAAYQYQDRDSRGVPRTSTTAPPSEARIDINHATISELLKVPGMTQSWAGRIVRFRPYRTKADLLERGVVSGAVYDRIKNYVIAHRDQQ